ncbi:gamma-glutamylcyclotransferase family protein [Dyella sp. OK004]|uniref:gamma-glutamylcyclotransferase family protein n=1 Tax=Dyella sp. OK004 TaxID=1855292 RepID=UPI000B899DCB|nr:gamma-glutamylcyclotransferase family protein [Dyella sp. OK004]
MPHLFSYGTLQQEGVQISTFGRLLAGTPDRLRGFRQSLVEIDDPEVVRTSGMTHHPIVMFTGIDADEVSGVVFEITGDELMRADTYEVSAYIRVRVTLASGISAWAYVDARFAPPEAFHQ